MVPQKMEVIGAYAVTHHVTRAAKGHFIFAGSHHEVLVDTDPKQHSYPSQDDDLIKSGLT